MNRLHRLVSWKRIVPVSFMLLCAAMPALAGGTRESSRSSSATPRTRSETWISETRTKTQMIATGYSVVEMTWEWRIRREIHSGSTRLESEPRIAKARVVGGYHTGVRHRISNYRHVRHAREVHWRVTGTTTGSSPYPWIPTSMPFVAHGSIRY